MKRQSLAETLNRIIDLFHLGNLPEGCAPPHQVFYESLEHDLSLMEKERELFNAYIDDLLNLWSGVKGTVSREMVIDQLIPLVRAKKVNDGYFSPAEAQEFEQGICGLQLQMFRVVRPIYGLAMAPEAALARFGDFEIDFGRRILISDGESALLANVLTPEDEGRLFIQCRVAARDTKTAFDLADAIFYRFELIFRFFIGSRSNWIEVGVVNYSGAQLRDRFIFSEDGRPVGHGSQWDGALQHFIVGHPGFPVPTPPLGRLFELITRPNSEFEKHLIRCAEWTGQAISEPNEAAALVKAAIALEVLFSQNEKGLITPSIMAQISESCAFLLGSEIESRLEIERRVKHLYGVRSAVVHSGKDSVDSKDLNEFIEICRRVVIHLLSGDEFVGIGSMANLAYYFRARKYA